MRRFRGSAWQQATPEGGRTGSAGGAEGGEVTRSIKRRGAPTISGMRFNHPKSLDNIQPGYSTWMLPPGMRFNLRGR